MEQQQKRLFVPDQQSNKNVENNLDFSYIKEEIYKPIILGPELYEFRFPSPTGLELKKSIIENIGMGVFTNKNIESGEIIERVRTIRLSDRARYQHDETIKKYMLTDSCACRECLIHGVTVCIMTGFGSFYNHQQGDTQNCKWIVSNAFDFLDIVAIKDIKAGDELFLYYGDNYFKTRKYIQAPEKKES
jgi:hypothetical protein